MAEGGQEGYGFEAVLVGLEQCRGSLRRPRLRRVLARSHSIHLSQRQAQVALLILQGHSSVSIGLRLGVSAQTVKVFRRQIHARCGISSQAELFALLLPLLVAEEA